MAAIIGRHVFFDRAADRVAPVQQGTGPKTRLVGIFHQQNNRPQLARDRSPSQAAYLYQTWESKSFLSSREWTAIISTSSLLALCRLHFRQNRWAASVHSLVPQRRHGKYFFDDGWIFNLMVHPRIRTDNNLNGLTGRLFSQVSSKDPTVRTLLHPVR